MTLLHQAAQKAVEALTSIADFDQWNWSDRETVRQMKVIARAALESAALQHQEVPREPVAHFPIIYAILRPALSTGNIAVRQHAERLAEVLEGDQLAAVRELLDRQPATSEPARVIHAASPSTTRQQEVGNEPDAMEEHRTNGLAWAVSCWQAEVMNRPLVNVHRRTLDDTWRQVIRYFGGDPDKLLGPNHDTLHMRAQEERAWKP